jgi:hypothetical protein
MEIILEIQTDSWGYELYWEIDTASSACGSTPIWSGGNTNVGCNGGGLQTATPADPGVYPDGATIIDTLGCYTADSCLTIHLIDDYGDGGNSVQISGDIASHVIYSLTPAGSKDSADFCLTPAPLYNSGLLPTPDVWYSYIPKTQSDAGVPVPNAVASSLGAGSITNVQANVDVSLSGSSVFTAASQTIDTLASGMDSVLSFTPASFTPASMGVYSAVFTVTMDSTDEIPGNESYTRQTLINDTILGMDYDTAFVNGSLGIGAGIDNGKLGQTFWTPVTDTLTSATAFLNGPTAGDSTKFSVWTLAGDTPSVMIAETPTHVFAGSDTNGFYLTLPFYGGIPFVANLEYVLVVHEYNENITLATTPVFYPGNSWVYWDNNVVWDNSENLGFPRGYLLRANFGELWWPTSIEEEVTISSLELKAYPNPASDITTVDLGEVLNNVNLNLFNIKGELVHTTQGSGQLFNIDMTEFANGVYMLDVVSEKSQGTLRVVKF